MSRLGAVWQQPQTLAPRPFHCGFCDRDVASREGYYAALPGGGPFATVLICPNCNRPTFFDGDGQVPAPMSGKAVMHLPDGVNKLYNEARAAVGAGAHTAAVLALRKLLMHVAVAEGAAPNLSFLAYVEYLDQKGFVPPKGKAWVDQIRTKGNEANHEIVLMSETDSTRLSTFTEMLLRFVYEFPNLISPT